MASCSDVDPHIQLERVDESAFRAPGDVVDERVYPANGAHRERRRVGCSPHAAWGYSRLTLVRSVPGRADGDTVPIQYAIDRNNRLLTRADGVVTFDEINGHLDLEQLNRDLDRSELIDARDATTDLMPAQVRQLVMRAAAMLRVVKLGPTAIVTTDDVVYGMARMYSILAEGVGARAEVFRDLESAIRWLNQVTANGD